MDNSFLNYVGPERWMSYHAQIDAVSRLFPTTVLEVGIKSGLVSAVLKQLGLQVDDGRH